MVEKLRCKATSRCDDITIEGARYAPTQEALTNK